jgi:hypothetical protein
MVLQHVETVLVANSDDHLAAVERAKRTGEPLESVSAKGSEIIPRDIAQAIAEEKGQQNTYVGRLGATYAAHLRDFHEAKATDETFIPATNEEKARQHEMHSAELVRQRAAQDAEVAKKIAEGFDVSLAVQQANLDKAAKYEGHISEYERARRERAKAATPVLDVVEETVTLLNSGKLSATASLDERVAEMKQLSSVTVPESLEKSTEASLITKDKIISVEESFAEHAASAETLAEHDRPALAILDAASSPEDLEESTEDAQVAASRIHQDTLDLMRGVGADNTGASITQDDGVDDAAKDEAIG